MNLEKMLLLLVKKFVNRHLIPETIWHSLNGPLGPHGIITIKSSLYFLSCYEKAN